MTHNNTAEPVPQSRLAAVWAHPVCRIGVFTALFFSFLALGQVALAVLPTRRISTSSESWLLFYTIIELASVLLAAWIMVRLAERRRMQDIGFTWRGIVTDTTAGAAIGMAVISCSIGILALLGIYRIVGVDHAFRPWIPLAMFLAAGAAEETFFRGYILRVLEYRYGSLVALAASSLLFGLVHLLSQTGQSIPIAQEITGALFIAFEAGILLGAAYIATRRMWLPIGIHWAWNYFEGPVYGADISGIGGIPSQFRSVLHGPVLLSGGLFGPEASVVALAVCTVAGLAMVRVAIRAGKWTHASTDRRGA